MELMQVNRQWSTRPSDERFLNLIDLHAHCDKSRNNSSAKVLSSRALTALPIEGDNKGLAISGPNGVPVAATNWAFGQLAQRAGAPAGYMRDLPSPLAADCLNYGLHHNRDISEIGVLLHKNGGPAELRAVTGPNYGRIWNSTVTGALLRHFGDGITGDFRVPGEFGKAVGVTKENTTLYASDRDFFVFLADEDHRIEIANRRNGQSGSLARGVFFWNSEVGAGTLGMAGFLFDYACSNRIVWGAQDYQEIKIRHTSSAPDRWIESAMPAIEAYKNHGTASIEEALKAAQLKKIENVDTFLAGRFSRTQCSAIKAAHMADEQRPIETLWDAATAVTAYARGIQYQDERVKLEREGGRILKLAA